MAKNRRGFTLIELLTVIAIIALLAALLFPVFSRVSENRRHATCMSNMHDLWVAASLYKDDKGGGIEYPTLLFGAAERSDKLPWLSGDPTPVPMGSAKRSFLYPVYIKDVEKFHCPDDPSRSQTDVANATYPPSSAWSTLLPGGVASFNNSGIVYPDLPASYTGKPVGFYSYDSYDISAAITPAGKRPLGADGKPGFQVVYSRDWTAARARAIDPKKDSSNQLLYVKSLPPDRTVLCWCNYHVTTAGADKAPMIFVSGTAKPLDWKQMLTYGYNVANH